MKTSKELRKSHEAVLTSYLRAAARTVAHAAAHAGTY